MRFVIYCLGIATGYLVGLAVADEIDHNHFGVFGGQTKSSEIIELEQQGEALRRERCSR